MARKPNLVGGPDTLISEARPGRIFYGWWIVATTLVSMIMSAGFGYYALSAFFAPLKTELGWDRALISGAISTASLLSGFAAPLAGRWTDRYGPKRLMLVGGVFLGVFLLAFSLASAVWSLYAAFLLCAIGRTGSSGIPSSTLVANWFARRRGTAMGLSTTGIGFGGVLTTPLAGFLIAAIGWRWTLVVFAVIVWAVLLPMVTLVIKTRPQEMGLWPDGGPAPQAKEDPSPRTAEGTSNRAPGSTEERWTVALAARTSSFWLIALAYAFVAFPISAVVLHAVPFFVGRGISTAEATTILGSTAALGIVGKLVCGNLADRVAPRMVLVIAILMQIAGLLILLNTNSPAMAWVYVLIFGFGMGGVIALTPLVVASIFGIASFGTIYGASSLFYAVGWAAGPLVAGLIYDATGSYAAAFMIDLALYALSAAAIFLTRPTILAKVQPQAPSPTPGTGGLEYS